MTDLTSRERLQPSLLDRLTDQEPEQQTESSDKRVLNLSQLKASVLRDLAWLLNTNAAFSALSEKTTASSSTVNYGLPALAGHTASNVDLQQLERLLSDAILTYEPRILRNSLRVRAQQAHSQMNHNALSFEIEGDLWAQPTPLRLLLRSEIDLESGQVWLAPAEQRRRA